MIVYESTKKCFREDVLTNRIDKIILDSFKEATGHSVKKNEMKSWKNSLPYMDRVLDDNEIPDDARVAIEYHLPMTSKRIDFILTGADADGADTAILIELKQWEKAELTGEDAVVRTRFQDGPASTTHPSYQAWSYKKILEDFNATVQEERIQLYPCAYLHNYAPDNVIRNDFYKEYIEKAPLFLIDDALKLRAFIKKFVKYGDKNNLMYRIDHGKIKPSKNLADNLESLLKGNEEFLMIDDQKVVYERSLRLALRSESGEKNVIIVEGGPGTGKSVVAVNLLVKSIAKNLNSRYVTRNSAPRQVYEAKLVNSYKRSRISNLFSGSGSFTETEKNYFDFLIVDEAHRLNEKSGLFSKGENQIKEIINSSKCSVFFIDESQKVTFKDIGEKGEIEKWAKYLGAKITNFKLESQFRCNGSDSYLSWLDNTLQIRETANPKFDVSDYDFRIIKDPEELHLIIKSKNHDNKARVVAGYCWDWISKENPILKDIVIGDYKATWNLNDDGQAWIIKPDSVEEVGCIHTCQGLEVDYIGVIVGKDLIVRNGSVITNPKERAATDKSLDGFKKFYKTNRLEALRKADEIIKNTYRTLMTRGQKGCYVYFEDEETRQYFESRIIKLNKVVEGTQTETIKKQSDQMLPFRILPKDEAVPYRNCVPLYDLEIAAGDFSDVQHVENVKWVELPEHFKHSKDLFVAKVVGESMNRRIRNGSYCLFKANPVGTRNGKIVLAKLLDSTDTEAGGHYTVKIYESEKKYSVDGTWEHTVITLKPDSDNPDFKPIVFTENVEEKVSIIAELIAELE